MMQGLAVMKSIQDFWSSLRGSARLAFIVCGIAALVAIIVGANWLLRTDYRVLFSELSTRDSASVVAELEKAKIPFRLDESGASIFVPADLVHTTRLKLVGKDLTLQGSVGFELFNNNEVGVTDFAQRVNYLRALQGELSRTITAIEGIQAARVHLVLPEHGAFKRTAKDAKASVALTLAPAIRLAKEQVVGIQRLVGAAVPEIRAEEVTIVDQRGVQLNQAAGGEERSVLEPAGDGKQQVEEYLANKIVAVLDQAFGVRRSIARVDATLSLEQKKTTMEVVVPSGSASGIPIGTVVRETGTAVASGAIASDGATGSPMPRTRDVQYQVGRRVDQIVTPAGSVQRLNVAIVIRAPLDSQQTEMVKELAAAAVGLDRKRGDAIAVYSMDQLASVPAADQEPVEQANKHSHGHATGRESASPSPAGQVLTLAVGTMVLIVLLFAARNVRKARMTMTREEAAMLSERERAELLKRIDRWIEPSQPERGWSARSAS